MRDDLLKYMIGLFQAAAAALLASAIIMPGARIPALFGSYVCAMTGLLLVYLKNMEK